MAAFEVTTEAMSSRFPILLIWYGSSMFLASLYIIPQRFHPFQPFHEGVPTPSGYIRQSISLPAAVAVRVRSMAETRRLSANRMLVELIEDGMEAQTRKQQQFFELAERFRGASDPEEARRLGDELGRMVFGG